MRNISYRIWVACAAGIFANDHRSALAEDKPGTPNRILLVHGIADSAASMQMLRARLARDGREAFAINLKPGDGRISLEALSVQLRDYVGTHFSAGERIDLVGFSIGLPLLYPDAWRQIAGRSPRYHFGTKSRDIAGLPEHSPPLQRDASKERLSAKAQ